METLAEPTTHLPSLDHAKLAVPLLPQVEARLANAQLPKYVDHGRSALLLAQRVGDLLFRKPLALYAPRLPWWETSEQA